MTTAAAPTEVSPAIAASQARPGHPSTLRALRRAVSDRGSIVGKCNDGVGHRALVHGETAKGAILLG